jgi:ABC-type transport system involved in multi-copper enzyme maturation permease subunit
MTSENPPVHSKGRISFGKIMTRAFVSLFSLMIALCAGITFAAIALFVNLLPQTQNYDPVESFFVFAPFVVVFVSSVSFIPALIGVVLTEVFCLRHFIIYALFGVVTAFSPWFLDISGAFILPEEWRTLVGDERLALIMAASGLIGGLVYWLMAGRHAGDVREKVYSAAPTSPPQKEDAPQTHS